MKDYANSSSISIFNRLGVPYRYRIINCPAHKILPSVIDDVHMKC